MTITPQQFHESEGVDDWRVLWQFACTHFETGSFAKGLELVNAIGELAEAVNHHPDVDLRYPGVTVRLTSHDVGSLSQRDVDLARKISNVARDLEITADPGAVRMPQVTIDAMDIDAVRPFWQAVLGYVDRGPEDLEDPMGHGPPIWFQEMDASRPERNRIHIDVPVAPDQARARVEAAIAAGGRLVTDAHAPAWWVVADPEGNEACIATWQGRE